ncbi:hypothetical protein ACFLQK_02715 [bacterium]
MSVHEQLREMLDTHPAGCPPAEEIIEILQILFTGEEAKVALGLGFIPFDLKTVSERAEVAEEEAEACLESLADKGMVFVKKKDGAKKYALLPVMPGVFEFPYMKGEKNETLDRLTGLWKTYMGTMVKGFGTPNMAFSRIIPVAKTIESVPDVLTYEKVEQMIDKANSVGLAHCACRESEENCDAPREACMLFDDTCDYLVDRGFARHLTKEEMKQKLIEFDEAGLVHQVNNAQDRLTFICNCCPCCCGLLRSQLEFGNPNVFNASGFVAECDTGECSQCGICVDERCPMEAIEMANEGPVIDEAKCLGCGLCVTGCNDEAMKLVRRGERTEPAKTNRDMGITVLTEQGKLEGFMLYVNPDARPKKD